MISSIVHVYSLNLVDLNSDYYFIVSLYFNCCFMHSVIMILILSFINTCTLTRLKFSWWQLWWELRFAQFEVFFCRWYLIVEADNEQKIVSDSRSKQWTEEQCFCCLLWLAWWWWSLIFMFIYCEVVNFYQFISFIFCLIFFLLQLLFLHLIFILLFYLIFYSFCKVVLYDFIEYHNSSEYKLSSWFDVQWVDYFTSEDKKEDCWSILLFLSLRFRNVFIFHLCTSFAVDSAVSDLIALFIADDHSCTFFIIFIMLIYMKNLSSSVQHHKIVINVYCKNVSVKKCKKCVERDVECVKIKFSIEKNSKKCALCAVFETNCQYES